MKCECKKTENCFADSQSYEYRLPLSIEELSALLPEDWSQRRNLKLRRPVLIAERGGVQLKGVLESCIIKASFPEADWCAEKARFEAWLEETDV
ncbi:MAG: hypothetical protein Q4B42_04385 [Oscillospiraceae bacterium]|nr:hypothetical protein [Oscillospiraceae bacterium]